MIKLGRLRINNFKSFETPLLIDIRNLDLLIFDGPNGFGKTTLFDAIELCFTGSISRLINTDGKLKTQHLLKFDDKKPTSIFLELFHKETVVVIYVSLPETLSSDENKISNLVVKTRLLKEWPTSFKNEDSFIYETEKTLEDIIKNIKIKSTFNIFNYVQQEDACHFLKSKEVERHNKISYLFGTNHKHSERESISIIKDMLSSECNEALKKILILKDTIEKTKADLITLNVRDDTDNHNAINKITPILNLKNKTISDITTNIINVIKSDLDNLLWIVKNPLLYKNVDFNNSIDEILKGNPQSIIDTINTSVVKTYDEITKLQKHATWISRLEQKIISHESFLSTSTTASSLFFSNAINHLKRIHNKKFKRYEHLIFMHENITSKLEGNTSTINKILQLRHELNSSFHHYFHNESKENSSCPFCGDFKVSFKQLQYEFEQQTHVLMEISDSHSSELKHLEEIIKCELITPCIESSKRFIAKYSKYIDLKKALSESIITESRWVASRELQAWLSSNNIDFYHLTKKSIYEHNQEFKEKAYDDFIALLNASKINTDKDYFSLHSSLRRLELKIVNSNICNFNDIEILNDDIIACLNFLDNTKATLGSQFIAEKIDEVAKKELELEIKNRKLEIINSIHKKYTSAIKEYENSISKSISIPFFIYSSKILQTRSDGNGAHIKSAQSNRENGFLRFVSKIDDEHDAWNTMSSGQLSGLVISFMLAMNKVYPSNLSSILIDDPVHTMDDINFASFVELLKNDFKQSQIIISTHESKVANYFSSKYQRENNVKTINMKTTRIDMSNDIIST